MYEHGFFPDARRVAPISGSVLWLRLVVAFSVCVFVLEETQALMGATRPASGKSRQRLTASRVISAVCEPLYLVYEHGFFPDARRVAPISGSVLWLRLVVAFSVCVFVLEETQALMGATRPASEIKAKAHSQSCN